MQRRSLLKGAAAAVTLGLSRTIAAEEADPDYEDIDIPFAPTYRLFGTQPARGPEEDMARQILDSAPKGKSLIETARYFEGISEKNADGYMYNAQWPTRWNPVIVGFYQSTSLPKPYVYKKGDTIDWCAAFINWCLVRGGFRDTGNAMSGSFRLGSGLGKPTTEPKEGDIIVFKKADPKEAAVGFGHVGIFVEKVAGGYRVLGGNQKAGKKYSSVNTTFFRESGSLVFDSIRSASTIQKR